MFDRTIVRGLLGLSVVYLWRHGRLCRFVLVAAFVFSACGLAQAGWGTWTQIDGDASSSVVAGTYTTAVNLGGSSITINGVPFAAGGSSGTGYVFDSNWQSASPDSLSGVSGDIATLLDASVRPSHFFGFYNSNFAFNGLTAGDAYLATFFFPGTTAGGATGDVTYQFGAGSDLTYVTSPADASKGYYLSYSYTGQSSTLSFAFPAPGSENIRLAGFSNRLDVPPPPATSYPTWNAVGSGDWNNSSNWDNGIPNGVGATAIMGSANTGPTLVYTTSGETLGNLIFDSSNSYTLAGLPEWNPYAFQYGDGADRRPAGHPRAGSANHVCRQHYDFRFRRLDLPHLESDQSRRPGRDQERSGDTGPGRQLPILRRNAGRQRRGAGRGPTGRNHAGCPKCRGERKCKATVSSRVPT